MVFNRKGSFFLNLDESAPTAPATLGVIAPPAEQAEPTPTEAAVLSLIAPPAATPEPAQDKALTTAEAIAAELAAVQAAKPAVTLSTFAPECVTAGSALPMRRRRGGANLAGFRSMAGGLFGKP